MFLYTGKNNDNMGQWRTFIKMPLPKLNAGDQVIYGQLNLHTIGEYTT